METTYKRAKPGLKNKTVEVRHVHFEKDHEYVQCMNPVTKRYVLIDKTTGRIVAHKHSDGPYKNIKIVGKNYKEKVCGIQKQS